MKAHGDHILANRVRPRPAPLSDDGQRSHPHAAVGDRHHGAGHEIGFAHAHDLVDQRSEFRAPQSLDPNPDDGWLGPKASSTRRTVSRMCRQGWPFIIAGSEVIRSNIMAIRA
jgi:hypothetical protein